MIGAMRPIRKKEIAKEQLYFNPGGDGRYLWMLCSRAQTLNVWDLSDYTRTAITLTAAKDFSCAHYDPTEQVVFCLGNGWLDKVDLNPSSGSFLTVIYSAALTVSSTGYIIPSYLPPPIDVITTGGSSLALPGRRIPDFLTKDGLSNATQSIRIGGHSNATNIIYYPYSGVVNVNKIPYKLKRITRHGRKSRNYQESDVIFELDPYGMPYQDLQEVNFPVTKFGNFYIVLTGANAYLISLESPASSIVNTLSTLGVGSNRSMGLWCPNAKKMIVAPQITSNTMSVISINKTTRALVDDGDIVRTAYKATNEAGCQGLIYSPYNGYFYVVAHNNSASTGIDKIHEYDPNQAVGSMYLQTLTGDEFNSANRTSVVALNQCGLNRVPQWEYPEEFI